MAAVVIVGYRLWEVSSAGSVASVLHTEGHWFKSNTSH